MSGYSGGTLENPTYDQIHHNSTGHAESIQIKFDPAIIPYEKILDIFWHTHNPTTKNRQGSDMGAEYRSAIFYHNDEQKNLALKSKAELEKSGTYKDPVVTEIEAYKSFYPAEPEHLAYYENNRMSPYCIFVIDPKIRKLMEQYNKDVKEEFKK